MERSKNRLQGSIQLGQKYHTWQYKYPNLLLAGNVGTGRSQGFLWDEFINY